MLKEGLLEKLINLNGVSGDEHNVRSFIVKEAKKSFRNVKVDNMGNVVVVKKGKRPAIMFLAHMDEIGLMVSSIHKKGKMYISPLGGIDPHILLGQRVDVETASGKSVRGIITMDDVLNDLEIVSKVKMNNLYVYTGLNKIELAKLGVKIGSYISFGGSCNYCTLGGTKNMVAGKALDDRIGCYILLQLMKNLKSKNEITFVFTVQEEVGLYGAKASVFNLKPDYAVAVDVTGHDDTTGSMVLGKGPVLTIKDAVMIGNKCLNDKIQEVAKKLKIKLQLEVSDFGTTDASSIFAAKGGIPSSVLGVSVANLHTTMSIACRKDIDESIKVLNGFLKNPPVKCWS